MLKICCWKDKVSNADILKRIREKEPCFFREIILQKLAYTLDIYQEQVVVKRTDNSGRKN